MYYQGEYKFVVRIVRSLFTHRTAARPRITAVSFYISMRIAAH